MGLFSKKKTYVSSSAIPIFDVTPNPIQESVLRSLFRNESIADGLIEEAVNGAGSRLNQVFNYGRDHFTARLPTGSTERFITDTSAIVSYVEGLEVDPVTVTSVELERGEHEFFLKEYLFSNHGFNRFNQRVDGVPAAIQAQMELDKANYTVSLQTSLESYLVAIRNSIPVDRVETSTVTHNDKPATKYDTYTVASRDVVATLPVYDSYSYLVSSDLDVVDTVGTFNITFQSKLAISTKVQVMITYVETVTTHYVYSDSSESPKTTAVGNAVEVLAHKNNYIQSFVYNYTDTFSPTFNAIDSYYYIEYYIVSNNTKIPKCLVYLANDNNVAYPKAELGDAVPYYPVVVLREDNVDKFSASKVNTPLYQTSKQLLKLYNIDVETLVEGINDNPDIADIDHAFFMWGINLNTDKPAGLKYLIKYFDHLSTVQTEIDADSALTGFLVSQFDMFTDTPSLSQGLYAVKIKEGGLNADITWTRITSELIQGVLGGVGFVKREIEINDKMQVLNLYEQVDTNTYKLVRVYNPKHTNRVYKKHTVETDLKDLRDNDEEYNFIIPLHAEIVNSLDVFTKTGIYYEAPHLVFYSYQTVKLKWYQTGIFKALLVIVAVIVFISTGFDVYTTFIALLSGAGITAAIIYLTSVILSSILLNFAFKFAVKVLGKEFSFILAFLAVASFIYGNTEGIDTIFNTWADQLLVVGTNLSTAVNDSIKDELTEIVNQFSIFQEEANSLMDELEQKKELLNFTSLINPLEFVKTEPLITLNERPSNYYERTVHNVNVGPLAFDAIHNYVDISVSLPTPLNSF